MSRPHHIPDQARPDLHSSDAPPRPPTAPPLALDGETAGDGAPQPWPTPPWPTTPWATTPWATKWTDVRLYADLERYWARDVAKAVKVYEADPEDFYAAYYFLYYHPANTRRIPGPTRPGAPDSWFTENLHVMVTKVDPTTGRIEDTPRPARAGAGKKHTKKHTKKHGLLTAKQARAAGRRRNTRTEVWLEWGPYMEPADLALDGTPLEHRGEGTHSHDHRVDTGGASYEAAIINLAHNIYAFYGFRRAVGDHETLADTDRR